MANESNGNRRQKLTSSNEDLSEYTDADESISAPTEFLAEFLSALMLKDYTTALKYCKLILQYEPNNATAKEFFPLISEKLQNLSVESSSEGNGDSSSDDDEIEPKSSHSESMGRDGPTSGSYDSEKDDEPPSLEASYEGNIPDNLENLSTGLDSRSAAALDKAGCSAKGHRTDSDGTTNSYSSLEDEEVVRDDNILEEVVVEDNYADGDDNGNPVAYKEKKIPADDDCNFNWFTKVRTEINRNDLGITSTSFQTSSDSESPTDPVTQQTIEMLRAKFVHATN